MIRLCAVVMVAGCVAAAAEPQPAPKRVAAADAGASDGGPLALPPNIARGQLLTNVQVAPHKPTLPPELNKDGMVIWGLFKVCVSDAGSVTGVKVIKSADRLVDGSWVATIRTWRYRPYMLNGKPLPFCYPLRLQVAAKA